MIGESLFAAPLYRLKMQLQAVESVKRGFDKAMAHKRHNPTLDELRKLAAQADTGKGIDVGTLTHDGLLAWLRSCDEGVGG